MKLYDTLKESKNNKQNNFVVLLDPDKHNDKSIDQLIRLSTDAHVDYFFIGGSLMLNNNLDSFIRKIKRVSNIPCILFPGNAFQISNEADAILYLSLISGRNPDLLIGKHVETAGLLNASNLEVLPTGYVLIDGGKATSVNYMSNTTPIPNDKNSIAVATAMAGEMLGLNLIYLEAGSGASKSVSKEMIAAVSQSISIPLIVGGGITTPEKAKENIEYGADIIVVGNALEKDPELIVDLSAAIHSAKSIVQ